MRLFPLGPGDETRLEAFLAGLAESSMFLRSNLRAAGLRYDGRPYSADYVAAERDGEIVAVAAHGWNGMVLLQAPTDLDAVARAVVRTSGRPVAGLIGPWPQVVAARAALGLSDQPTSYESREVLFTLDLDALVAPPALARPGIDCRRALPEDVPAVAAFQAAFMVETLGVAPGHATSQRAQDGAARHQQAGNCFLLLEAEAPVSCCTINARLPDMVQIGGVYTPPVHRGRGFARAVVAGALAAERDAGARRAVLFTGDTNEPAQIAYRAIGFRTVGDYGLVLLRASP